MIYLHVSLDLNFRFETVEGNIPFFVFVESFENFELAGKKADEIIKANQRYRCHCVNLKSPNFELGEDTWGTVPENGYMKEDKCKP